MDREYGQVHNPFDPEDRISQPLRVEPEMEPIGLTTKEIGTSTGMMTGGVENLKSRIWQGASKVELAFIGAGKSSRQALTPGSFGKDERLAMRDLARVNKVEVSTHASVGVAGLAGFDGRESFSDEQRKNTIDEVKRAIDFAGDASTGGAVVVHTGEFPRAIVEVGRKYKVPELKHYEDEEKKATHYLVDRKKGRMISAVREDEVVWRPKPMRLNGEAVFMKDENDQEVKDKFIVEYNKTEKERARAEGRQYIPFEERIPIYEKDKTGNIQDERITFQEFEEQFRKKHPHADKDEIAKDFFRELQEAQIQRALGSSRQFEEHYSRGIDRMPKLLAAKSFYKRLKEESPEQYERAAIVRPDQLSQLGISIPSTTKDPLDYLEQEIASEQRSIDYGRETSVSGRSEARRIQDQIVNAESIEKYGLNKSAQSIAELGLAAMRKTESANNQLRKLGQEQIKPLYIAPENLFPESYGSHPQELKTLIQKSREQFTKMMVSQGKTKDEAKELAKTHIGATLDIGHANIWRKYWHGDPNKPIEQQDKEFKKWLLTEMKDLLDGGMIKHIHVGDNFGYHDEHLAPGMGNTPIKDFLKLAKEKGVTDIVFEQGSTNYDTMHAEVLTQYAPDVFKKGPSYRSPAPTRFDEVRLSYAGQVVSPYFTVPPYAPSEDWTLWSHVGLE